MFAASEHVPHLLKLSPKLPTLQMIVIMDEYEDEPRRVVEEWAKTRGISLKTIEQCTSCIIRLFFILIIHAENSGGCW